MKIIRYTGDPQDETVARLLSRAVDFDSDLVARVQAIVDAVRARGDEALLEFTERFDGIRLEPEALRVDMERVREAADGVEDGVKAAIRQAIANVRAFHERQLERSWQFDAGDGVVLGQRVTPLDSVGLYVPGGRAAYPSSLVMNAVPAQVAGVGRIVGVTPPGKFAENPAIAFALAELGVDELYTIGGAQAVAALAYGTRTIPKVDKIVGPGNQYVALAKKLVYGVVDIDSIAGPSEVVVLADSNAEARYVAADLLSQAEHDEMASAILVTPDASLAEEVRDEVARQLASLERRAIAAASVESFGAIFVVDSVEQGCELVNRLAPEHLELMVDDPEAAAALVRHAGAIFFGAYSSEPVGDYFAGPNHVLPTGGTARFMSPLGVYDFVKRTSIVKYTRERLRETGPAIVAFARAEGLGAHARAITIRLEDM